METHPGIRAFGMDLSERMLERLPPQCVTLRGSVLNIPCGDGLFDMAFCVEALEHAVNIPRAIAEMARVVKPGGRLIVIDKNQANCGQLETPDWEQWMSAEYVTRLMEDAGLVVELHPNLPYEDRDGSDGLFLGWVGSKVRSKGVTES
jgi:ubiquinone/menaquinone biosynthesis C-methylase UbiE